MDKRSFLPWRTAAIAAVVLSVAAIPGALEHLQYDRQAVLHGEAWRLITGHLVHASASHLIWDVLPLLALGLLFERTLGRSYWPVLLLSCVTVGAGLLAIAPRLGAYCGLSGVLNGIWVAGALKAAREERDAGNQTLSLLFRACVAADLVKIAIEAGTGSPIFTDPAKVGALPMPLAHVLGALAAVVAAIWQAPASGAKRDTSLRSRRLSFWTPFERDSSEAVRDAVAPSSPPATKEPPKLGANTVEPIAHQAANRCH